MRFLSLLLALLGYMLVYAGIANGGQFWNNPWKGLVQDAYTGDASSSVLPQGSKGGSESNSSSPQGGFGGILKGAEGLTNELNKLFGGALP